MSVTILLFVFKSELLCSVKGKDQFKTSAHSFGLCLKLFSVYRIGFKNCD